MRARAAAASALAGGMPIGDVLLLWGLRFVVNDWGLGVVVCEKAQFSCGKYVVELVGARLVSRKSVSGPEVSRHEHPWWPLAPQPGALQIGGRCWSVGC